MRKLLKRGVRHLLRNTRWERNRRSRDPFLVTHQLVQAREPLILDVGAHVGQSAARYRTLFPGATIHCFEPSPLSFETLSAAVSADPRIVAHVAAVSDVSGEAKLHLNRAPQTNSLLDSDHRGADYWGNNLLDTEAVTTVKTLALDDFCRENGIGHVDVLKIDVQGAEYAVLAGAKDLLARHAVDLLYMEILMAPSYVGQRKYHYYLTTLDELGYELFDLFNLGRHEGRLIQSDAIFVTPELLARYEGARRGGSGR